MFLSILWDEFLKFNWKVFNQISNVLTSLTNNDGSKTSPLEIKGKPTEANDIIYYDCASDIGTKNERNGAAGNFNQRNLLNVDETLKTQTESQSWTEIKKI